MGLTLVWTEGERVDARIGGVARGSRTCRAVPHLLAAEDDGGGGDAEAAPCLLGDGAARPYIDGVPLKK